VDWDKAGALGCPSPRSTARSLRLCLPTSTTSSRGGRVKRVFVRPTLPIACCPGSGKAVRPQHHGKDGPLFLLRLPVIGPAGSPKLERYNGFPSLNILGEAGQGKKLRRSHGDHGGFVKKLPQGSGMTGPGFPIRKRAGRRPDSSVVCLLHSGDLLCLAALYETGQFPSPFCWRCARGHRRRARFDGRGLPNDVYFQIGLLTTLA